VIHTSQWVKRPGFRVRVEMPTTRFFQGEAITGEARFESCSSREVLLRQIRVPVWAHIYSGLPEKVVDQVLFDRGQLSPLETQVHPFRIVVPKHAVLGWTGVGLRAGRGLLLLGTSLEIIVAPERQIAAAVELIADVTHHEIYDWLSSGRGIAYRARLKPASDLEDPGMGLLVKIQQFDAQIRGELTVAPVSQDLWQEIEKRGCDFRFELPVHDLTGLHSKLEDFCRLHPRLIRHLPIPSCAVPTAQSLPVPYEEINVRG
jgi:hypothetical protein